KNKIMNINYYAIHKKNYSILEWSFKNKFSWTYSDSLLTKVISSGNLDLIKLLYLKKKLDTKMGLKGLFKRNTKKEKWQQSVIEISIEHSQYAILSWAIKE